MKYKDAAKAMRELVRELVEFPDWVNVVPQSGVGWCVQPDFLGSQSIYRMEVTFMGIGRQGESIAASHVSYETDSGQQYFTIPWNDPDCDKKIAGLILDWLIHTWDDRGLKDAGYPKPALKGAGGARPKRGGRGA